MPKKNIEASNIPDEEILRHPNVPVALAARYIGSSTPTIYQGLQDERLPFGFATYNPTTQTWTYNISPGLLVKYKRGDLPTYRLREVQQIMAEGVQSIVGEYMSNLRRMAEKVCGA